MVNLLAVKMIVLIVVTNCYIVDFQYALFVLSHQDRPFLSYCGILIMGVARIFQRGGGHTVSKEGYSPDCHVNKKKGLLTMAKISSWHFCPLL